MMQPQLTRDLGDAELSQMLETLPELPLDHALTVAELTNYIQLCQHAISQVSRHKQQIHSKPIRRLHRNLTVLTTRLRAGARIS
jgi:hypothetical protein